MVTAVAFTALVAAVAVQRLWEVRRSGRHTRALLAAGGRLCAAWQTPMLAALHTTWLVATCLEVWWFDAPFHWGIAVASLAVFAAGQALRLAAMRALGPRWTIGIVTLPHAPPVTTGIYRYLRHPNYLGVMGEIAALPLVHGAYHTAVIFSVLNAIALSVRVTAEERALTPTRR